jgi:serine/threonine-protein kinase
VRITTQLIEAESDAHLWTEIYDRDLEDIFQIQSDVAQQIASALRVELTADEVARIEKKPTENLRAYNLYLMGRSRIARGLLTWDNVEAAASYFEQAIAEDPNFAAAYAELGFTYYSRLVLGAPRELAVGEYRRLAETAIALDPDDAYANAIMSYVHLWDGDLEAGEARQQRVLELAPSAARSYTGYAMWARRVDEQIAYVRIGLQFDPLDSWARQWLAEWQIQARRFAEAIHEAQEFYALDSDDAALSLADAYFHGGRRQEAREVYLHALEVYSSLERTPYSIAALAYINGMLERGEQARTLLRELEVMSQAEYVFPMSAAKAYATVGDAGRTFDWLERGLDELGNWFDIELVRGPLFDFLRTEPRYGDLLSKANPEILEKIGLEP